MCSGVFSAPGREMQRMTHENSHYLDPKSQGGACCCEEASRNGPCILTYLYQQEKISAGIILGVLHNVANLIFSYQYKFWKITFIIFLLFAETVIKIHLPLDNCLKTIPDEPWHWTMVVFFSGGWRTVTSTVYRCFFLPSSLLSALTIPYVQVATWPLFRVWE